MLSNAILPLILEPLNITKILLHHILVCSSYLWDLIERKRAADNTQGLACTARL